METSSSVSFLRKWGCRGHWGHRGCWGHLGSWCSWCQVIGQISTTQDSQTPLKPNLAWIFLTIRAKKKKKRHNQRPCIIIYLQLYGLFNVLHYKKVPLFCWFDHFLDFRAEILQIFWLLFWSIDDFINSFWLNLTFRSWSLSCSNILTNYGVWPLTTI